MLKSFFKYFITGLFLININNKSNAQNIKLNIVAIDTVADFSQKEFNFKTTFNNHSSCKEYIKQIPFQLHAQGFISASIDAIEQDSLNYTIKLFLGEKYFWNELKTDEKDAGILLLAGIKKPLLNQKNFNANTVTIIQNKLLNYFLNNGYPFATIKFDSIKVEEKKISGHLKIEQGFLYQLDSIRVFGSAKISKDFLHKHLDIEPKSFYNEEKLAAINNKLSELNFVNQTASWQLTMLGSGFLIDIFIENKKSNQIDAIIGFLPNTQQVGKNLLITADAKINLQNAFATGETITANWQQLQPKSPKLNLYFNRPFIFKTKFGFNFNFDLFKRDSSFLNLQTSVGIQYGNSIHQKIKIFIQNNQYILLDVDTNAIKLSKQLPQAIDASVNNLLFAYEFNNTNYKLNPQKGNEILLQLSGGTRTVKINNTISQIKDVNFNYNNLYNAIKLKSYQLKIQSKLCNYQKIGKQTILKSSIQFGIVNSPQVYKNEMFLIGGFKTLRGFDEESIFADKFGIASLEYRYIIARNSYFNIFTDAGLTNNIQIDKTHNYIAFGGGMSFETKQGILNISLGVGKRNDTNFNLRQTKLHIGFISIF